LSARPSSDIAFTDSVKAIQSRKGSRQAYARMEQRGGWQTEITPDLRQFIEAQRSIFIATATIDAQPYIQHRGGPKGFLRVLDDRTLAFADFRGNRQYISMGNLADNPKVHLFLMDYTHRQRVKIWGTAEVVEDDVELLERLMPTDYDAVPERAFVIHVAAWDANCPQHIPLRLDEEDVAAALEERDQRIRELTGR